MVGTGRFRHVHLGRAVVAAGAVVGLLVASAGPAWAGQTAPRGAPPVIYDSDLDFDDASTLAYLCRAHQAGRIELRAVTVTNNGIGVPGRALTHARTILHLCGLPDIPVAEGTDEWVNEPPPEAREGVETILADVLDDAGVPHEPAPGAAQLIADTVAGSSTPVTILATGPLTNVSDALDLMTPRTLHRNLGGVVAMAGAVDVGGNLFGSTTEGFDNTQEVNAWIDPPATRAVVGRVPEERLRLVPLDATNHVPVTDEFAARLAGLSTPEGRLVHGITTHPEVQNLKELGALYWWDVLAAVSLVRGEGVTYGTRTLDVVVDGASAGRTADVPGGSPQRVGVDADQARFEALFLEGLVES